MLHSQTLNKWILGHFKGNSRKPKNFLFLNLKMSLPNLQKQTYLFNNRFCRLPYNGES